MSRELLAPPGFMSHWDAGLSNDDYHRPGENLRSVSSTGLRQVLQSPRRYQRLTLQGRGKRPSKAMIKGTMVHEAILEGQKFLDRYRVMPDFQDTLREPGEERLNGNLGRVKSKQKEWLAENAGSLIVGQKEFDEVRWMMDSLIENDDVMALFKDGTPEVAGYWPDPKTGILCRLKPDFLSRNGSIVSDLKTTRSLRWFSKQIWDERYDLQLGMYCEGAEQINRVKVQFQAFVVVENEEPFESAVFVADEKMMEVASADYRTALDVLRKCIDTNSFPRHNIGFKPIALPGYAEPVERIS